MLFKVVLLAILALTSAYPQGEPVDVPVVEEVSETTTLAPSTEPAEVADPTTIAAEPVVEETTPAAPTTTTEAVVETTTSPPTTTTEATTTTTEETTTTTEATTTPEAATTTVAATTEAATTTAASNEIPTQEKPLSGKSLRVVMVAQSGPYKGLLEDLLQILQSELGFTSTTEELMVYGVKKMDGQWNGMVGRLVDKTADVALADLTITPWREEAIDFTVPFVDTGISVLMNQADVGDIKSVEDLANQEVIKCTAVRWGSTFHFLGESKDAALSTIYARMTPANGSNTDTLSATSQEGIEKVKSGGYCMFLEELVIRYMVNNNCGLTQVGGLLNDIGYGIGLQKNSPYTTLFSQTVTKLKDEGKIRQLIDKHWVRNSELEACPSA